MTLPTTRAHLDAFFERVNPVRGRLIFALEATASRQPTWDTAAHLQGQMFGAAAGLDVQLIYFRGNDECSASPWQSDATSLATTMARVTCAAGHTQIRKVLARARKEHAGKKVDAVIIVSDACEETPYDLYAAARELGVPCFLFQEGADEHVGQIYAEIAGITGGAHCKFDSGAAQRLAELLKAVAAFAAGGLKALASQQTKAATLLLTQMKK
jgi:hypothetical protein